MGDHLGGLGSQLVAHGDGADYLAVVFDEDGGGPGVLHARHPIGERARVEPAGPAEADGAPVATSVEPGTGDGLHVGGWGDVVDGGEDRRGQRVLAARFQGRS